MAPARATVRRLAGALLLEVSEPKQYFLIGNTKAPCDFAAAGFAPPGEIDAMKRAVLPLERVGEVRVSGVSLTVAEGGESGRDDDVSPALASLLAQRFVIERNGSVSDRLWTLVVDNSTTLVGDTEGAIDARWLLRVPNAVWQIVRDAVLRCV